MDRINEIVNDRLTLEKEGSQATAAAYDALQKRLFAAFKEAASDAQRIDLMLEMMRILENRLVYLHHFIVDPTSDNRVLAQLVTRFIDQLVAAGSTALTKLEATYYRAVAALYAGDLDRARDGFRAACESEESDEANDIKYKSYVILGNLSHEERDYARAKELHHESIRYAQHPNITAQALALKALSSYALNARDEALHLFRESLQLFDPDGPFFNSYFYRNALLFCGAIHFDRGECEEAERDYRQVLDSVEQTSYDFFDALTHLGRIYYAQERFDDAAASFERAVQTHRFSETEYLVDTWFWIARCHLKRNDPSAARPYLEKIAATEVTYHKKPQAMEMLQKIA
jgi:tetratricopeptide (TPR) repeat protein